MCNIIVYTSILAQEWMPISPNENHITYIMSRSVPGMDEQLTHTTTTKQHIENRTKKKIAAKLLLPGAANRQQPVNGNEFKFRTTEVRTHRNEKTKIFRISKIKMRAPLAASARERNVFVLVVVDVDGPAPSHYRWPSTRNERIRRNWRAVVGRRRSKKKTLFAIIFILVRAGNAESQTKRERKRKTFVVT